MAGFEKLLRANRTVLAVPVIDGPTEPLLVSPTGTTAPFSAPTAAVLNAWIGVNTPGAVGGSHGGNISCALLDDMTLGTDASDTDDELTICSIGNEQVPTFYNVTASLTGLVDINPAAQGVFNLWKNLMKRADIRYVLVDRIGYSPTTAVTAGQDVSLYLVSTDNAIDLIEDRANVKLQQNFSTSGILNQNYTIAA